MRVLSLTAMNCCGFVPLVAARAASALHALALGAGPFQVGLLAVVNRPCTMLLSIPVGAFADRRGPRWLFPVGMLAGIAGLQLPYWFPGRLALFAAAALIGAVGAANGWKLRRRAWNAVT